jgi:RNA polymerase sigma-70 factor, ECF subfamily
MSRPTATTPLDPVSRRFFESDRMVTQPRGTVNPFPTLRTDDARLAGGAEPDQPPFEAQLRPHLAGMHRVARRVVQSDDLAWDVVQETALAIWERGHLPAGGEGPVLRELCVLRARQLRRSLARRAVRERAACTPDAHAEPADSELMRSELGGDVLEALAELPEGQRQAFLAYELGGHSYECIAESTGVSVGTVRSRLHRARRTLRERLVRIPTAESAEAAR